MPLSCDHKLRHDKYVNSSQLLIPYLFITSIRTFYLDKVRQIKGKVRDLIKIVIVDENLSKLMPFHMFCPFNNPENTV